MKCSVISLTNFYTLNKYELSYAVCKRLSADKLKINKNQQKEIYA